MFRRPPTLLFRLFVLYFRACANFPSCAGSTTPEVIALVGVPRCAGSCAFCVSHVLMPLRRAPRLCFKYFDTDTGAKFLEESGRAPPLSIAWLAAGGGGGLRQRLPSNRHVLPQGLTGGWRRAVSFRCRSCFRLCCLCGTHGVEVRCANSLSQM